jgi:hypothetical protein
MGRRRKSPEARAAAAKRRKQAQQKRQKRFDDMSYREYEDYMASDEGKQAAKLEGGQFWRNQPGMLSKNQIESKTRGLGLKKGSKEYKDFVRKHTPRTQQDILREKRRAYEDSLVSKDNFLGTAKEVAQGQMGGGGSPKGQPQGASPKGQPMQDNTGAAAGTYMNRVRNQRGAAGRPGFGQFAPTPMASPKGQSAGRGGSPKGQPPPRTGGPTPPSRADLMRGSYERMPQRRRAYNPATGLIE